MPETSSKMPIVALNCNELTEKLGLDQKFRAKQIFKWISEGVESFDQMTNLSKALREDLDKKATLRSSKVTQKLVDDDGTVKLQLTLSDSSCVETVLLKDKSGRKTACVSCQVGCAMKCAFCKTGTLGFKRNLHDYEIIEQFLFLEKECGKLDNIVFMGMGEPMLNLAEIRKAIAILSDKDGRNLSTRRITISTCGITKGIYDLADNGPKVRLAISLTTANQQLREKLMPVAKENDLVQLKKAIQYFIQKTGKRCTLEAALISGVNTDKVSAQNMIQFAKGMDVLVNLIPWNPVEGLDFKRPSKNECQNFCKMLEASGVNVTMRISKGKNIGGSCGQLGKVSTE